MPLYLYKCKACGYVEANRHGMLEQPEVTCTCGQSMHKVPQQVVITWNGRKPSDGGVTGAVQDLINTADERRDDLQARK